MVGSSFSTVVIGRKNFFGIRLSFRQPFLLVLKVSQDMSDITELRNWHSITEPHALLRHRRKALIILVIKVEQRPLMKAEAEAHRV